MEAIAVLFALGLVGLVLVGPIVAIVSLVRVSRLQRRLDELAREVASARARERVSARPSEAAPAPAVAPLPAVALAATPSAPAVPIPTPPAPPVAAPPPVTPAPPATAVPPRPPLPPRPSAPPAPPTDFVTTLGPRILVATGALAFTIFLALFVKYAWDNDWVGPTGRVLSGAVLGIGLCALGVRFLSREYRPLGQGLIAAGLAGLYASAFASHGFYDLVPRGVAGFFMVAITASAVLFADRLGLRLLASLAWIGGYLMPVLLSTGEDRALALFAYLALLDLGALVLDHRKPWPETVPLAMIGTFTLYTGWFAKFFLGNPARFEMAALGLVLFTALFLLGMAKKEREAAMAVVIGAAAVMLTAIGAQADRPEVLSLLSLGLAGAALWGAARLSPLLALGALLAVGLPLFGWGVRHLDAGSFAFAAAWLVAGALGFVLLPRALAGPDDDGDATTGTLLLHAAVMVAGGIGVALLVDASPAPIPVAALLLAWALVAILARRAFPYAPAAGASAALLAVHVWMNGHFDPARAWAAWTVALPVVGAFLGSVSWLGLRRDDALDTSEVAAHLATAALAWSSVYRILDRTRPELLGPAAVVLGAVYLALGIAVRRARPVDLVHARTTLGLAAGFLTLAIPVQLGLHGITLGWAIEGLLLLALGMRFRSPLTRGAGYAVLALAALRLFARHLPLHPGSSFEPVLNAPFATWVAVIAALAAARWITREARDDEPGLDRVMNVVLATSALGLLFILLTGETSAVFAQMARRFLQAGDAAGALGAERSGALALSVLWTVFATGLLAGGLAARSHGLFYASYVLFAVTALKVVAVDLGSFPVPYRMFSFLALGLLLMAGAYLNLRFRERLATRETGGA